MMEFRTSWRLAAEHVSPTWWDQDRSEVMVTPRYFTEVLGGMVCPDRIRLVLAACLERLIRRSWVLE